jgi:gliding motility-associated-like protein
VNAPNVFTPNDDNTNELYILDWKNLVKLRLVVLNRWGNVLFDETSSDLVNFNPGWDGYQAQDGVYFYRYEAEGISGATIEGHGFFHLIRNE